MPHPSVRRTEQVCVYEFVGIVDVNVVCNCPMLQRAKVMIGVVANLMTFGNNLLEEVGILVDIVAYHEECCLDIVFSKCVKNKRRALWNRTVIEC